MGRRDRTAGSDRDFPLFWSSQTAGAVGDRLTGFIMPTTAILLLDASDAQVGAVAAAGWLAYPLFGLFAGALLAHARVRRVMVGTELVRFCVFAGVALAVAAGWVHSAGVLVAAVAVAGVATVFTDISGQMYLPALVGPERLLGANSRLQSTDSASKLAGPAAAGAVIGAFGPVVALALGALPFLVSAFGRSRISADPEPVRSREPVFQRVREGFRYTSEHPVLGRLALSSAVRMFGTGVVDTALLLYAYRELRMSSTATGLLLAVGAACALAGVVFVGPAVRALGLRGALRCTALEGLVWCAVPLCLVVPAPVAVLFTIRALSAVWIPAWAVINLSVRQRLAPADRQSTVLATARVLASSAVPLGALTAGIVTDVLRDVVGGSRTLVSVIAVGGVCIAVAVLLLPQGIPNDAEED
ncbi:MFS transporter [Lentzea tibetensis]|uniref:MFS transporter n=1 Tax=Lentzea tibetensis TaxID=2591470 RepID=A0A563EJT1_9PSEU|nr:MFS transporter [Lentzea tibetensis]TWP47013.1 MFS transporter [Lentzea tibetensis]